jgi:hypothetical protein
MQDVALLLGAKERRLLDRCDRRLDRLRQTIVFLYVNSRSYPPSAGVPPSCNVP